MTNHILMHWFSLIIALVVLSGTWIIELRKTIASVFLPLLSLAWAAAMVRFDFFIHRQAAYLRALESQFTQDNSSRLLWESWKMTLRSTRFVVPIADLIACAVIVAPTVYLLFGPSYQFFQSKGWKGGKAYAWTVTLTLFALLLSLAAIPTIAGWGASNN
jgi:hypothetical protein